MFDAIWRFLETTGFQPHGFCLTWRPDVFWTHVISDLVTAMAYFSIPVAITALIRRRRDIEHVWVLHLFSFFIVACGVTHLLGVWVMWVPGYGLEAIAKAITAMASVATAIVLWPMVPVLISLPSRTDLEQANRRLVQENAERVAAESRLRVLNQELEHRVSERTADLELINADLREAKRQAEASSAAKSEFLAMISHELRTPLNGVLGMTDLLSRKIDDGEPRRLLSVIQESGLSLLAILNDLLDFSKIESGALDLEEARFRLSDTLSRVATLHQPKARAKGLDLVLETTAGADRLRVGDPHRIRQILDNLVSNAIKFTDRGRVVVAVEADPAWFAIEVRDTGIGIPEDKQETIFDHFVQADASITRRFGGTGLGLAIVRRLVDAMGGSLEVSSIVGEGTVFRVRLPLAEVPEEIPDGSRQTDAAPATVPAPVRILAADDNDINREVLEAMLVQIGASCVVVEGGREALQAYRPGAFDLILLDISMPGMDGVEALEAIRSKESALGAPPVPALAVTAHALPDRISAFLRSGFAAVVTKPVDLDLLASAIAAHLPGPGSSSPSAVVKQDGMISWLARLE